MGGRRVLAAALAAGCVWGAPAARAANLPVPWTGDFSQQARDPNSPPAGSNDWSCVPSAAHPDPVILVHGLAANRTVNWPTISPFLANRGFCVYALTYGTKDGVELPFYQPGGVRRMQASAHRLKDFAGKVMRRTGAEHVDVVGHSEGSLMPDWWVKYLGGDRVVDDYVGISPLWDGTNPAGLASLDQIGREFGGSRGVYALLEPYCASCRQFLTGSRFMAKLNAHGGPRVPGVDYTTIMTRNDELVAPYTSGYMDGADNVVVQDVCPLDQSEHLSVIFDPTAAYTVLNALDPQHQRPVPCVPVLPFIGAPGYSE